MGLLDKLFGKTNAKALQKQNAQPAGQGAEHLRRAIGTADDGLKVIFSQGRKIVSGSGEVYIKIQEELEKVVQLYPENPYYRYLLADAKINAGLRETGREEIIKIAREHPGFVEAEGFAQAASKGLNWSSPFHYPRWNATMNSLPEGMIPFDTQNCLPLTIFREGDRRIVSFVGNIQRRSLGSNFRPDLRTTLKLNFMKTPFASIVGVYVLIDTDPREPYTSEQLINIESYSKNSTRIDALDEDVGYFVIQLLASQPYTYVVINDFQQGVFFNRKLEISGNLASHLNDVVSKIRKLDLRQQEDIASLQKANQYYFDHFSIDGIRF